jgi:hypothetical protein
LWNLVVRAGRVAGKSNSQPDSLLNPVGAPGLDSDSHGVTTALFGMPAGALGIDPGRLGNDPAALGINPGWLGINTGALGKPSRPARPRSRAVR